MTTSTLTVETLAQKSKSSRIESIDLLRGIVMILMALDHVRDYFHADAFLYNPLDLTKTDPATFFTRWITHFCAPVFVFLAGTSAFLVGTRKGKSELSSFLWKRGVWLIVLEFTVINFSWFFNVEFSFIALTVIWALGLGMILLAAAIHLPFKAILVLGIVLVAGHNLLDPIHVPGTNASSIGWALLHEANLFSLDRFLLFVGYPILPWTGVMLLGYCFGALYKADVASGERRKFLLRTGLAMIVGFVVLRMINYYGDPSRWSEQDNAVYTFLSFINVSKYPPSLFYILVTLGPSMSFLAVSEKFSGRLTRYITALGRVPMFYYVVHIYVIHVIALFAALATGFTLQDMIFNTWVTDSPRLKGYGFNLATVYLVWTGVIVALFPLCIWYDRYKTQNRHKWWLSYF
jgi:uncharacterized membrane protein